MRTRLAVVLLWTVQSFAQPLPDAAKLREDVSRYLAKPLPATASIVGIAMPKPSPMVVVASFGDTSQPVDGDRGFAVGRTLNELLFGAHEALDVERPQYYPLDSGMPNVAGGRARDSRGNAYRVATREGAQWCVWGNVDGDARAYRVVVVVDRCSDGAAATSRTFVVASDDEWPRTLRELCEHVVVVAAGALGRAQKQCARGESVRPRSFLAYANVAAMNGMPFARLESIVRDDPKFVPAAMDLIDRLPATKDLVPFYRRLDATVDAAGGTLAIVLAAYSRKLPNNWDISQRAFTELYGVIRANPQVRAGWLVLASGLAETATWGYPTGNAAVDWVKDKLAVEGARYYPNEATHQASLAISLDYYANWPQSYRARWQMGYALIQYAWMVRGNATWDKVPAKGRRAWRPLMRLADSYIVAAIEQQPGAPALWSNRIVTTFHTGGDWLLMFDKAAERHPHAANVYESAMLYAQPKWGGSEFDRTHIQDAAVRNNPGAAWATTLVERYAATGTL